MPESPSPHSTTDVVILGAGVAGLAAARDLSMAGFRVAVVEARSRVGGRIFTQHDPGAVVPLELGAEFVHGKPPEILEIVNSSHLMLCDTAPRHWFLQSQTLFKTAEFRSKLDDVMEQLKSEQGREDHSFRDFLEARAADPETKSIATMFVQGFHAAGTERIGVHGLNLVNSAAAAIEDDAQFRILNAYDQIPQLLREQALLHGAEFHVNAVVEQVRWSRNQVDVVTVDGCTFEARAAVVTLPLGVLQSDDVRFLPELSDKKQAAQSLAMGNALKVILVFRERFWERLKLPGKEGKESLEELGFLHAPAQVIPTWWTQLPVRAPVLTAWVGGPPVEKLLQENEPSVIDAALESLSAIMKVPRKQLNHLLISTYCQNWQKDPFSRGAYSYIPVGALHATEQLAAPVEDTLFFAGEASNTEGHIGTVHGALATGYRAAREIVRRSAP